MPGPGRSQWGWHRLADRYAEQIVQAAGVGPNDLVLDVGAGTGALTAPLVATGARVIAIELNAERAALLRSRFEHKPKVKVVRADGADLWLPQRPFRVVANPPFAITAALLSRLLSPASKLESAHLVLQRQAARRYATGVVRVAGKSRVRFDIRIDRTIPRSAFHPRPQVDVALLAIRRLGS